MAVLRERTTELPECDDWWEPENEADAGELITRIVTQLGENQRWRRTACQRYAQIYTGHPDGGGVVSGSELSGAPSTVVNNVCHQAVTTVVPKVSKHRPLPRALTTFGNWAQNKRARKMTQYLEGVFKKKEIFEVHWDQMHFDAGIYGDGLLKIEPRGRGINTERVKPWEYYVDSYDATDGKPRNSHHIRTMDLGQAIAIFGKRRKGEKTDGPARERRIALTEAATSAPDPNWDLDGVFTSTVKRVRLATSWHICDDDEAHEGITPTKHECNGRKCTTILGNKTAIEYEPWDWPNDPVHALKWEKPQSGSRGLGLVRRLEAHQERITTLGDKVDDAMRVGGGVLVMAQANSNIKVEEFSNEAPVCHVAYDGTIPPVPVVLPTVDPSVLQHEASLAPRALNEFGISLQSAAGQKHPGVNSGIGIEQIAEIEDEHWVPMGHASERVALAMAKSFIRCMIQIAKDYGEDSTAVQVKMRDGYLKLRWADVSLNDFQVEVFPSSVLPQRPANRLERLKSLFSDGIIDRQTFLQQLGAPDLGAEIDLVTAGRVAIDEMLEAVLDAEGEDELNWAVSMAMPNSYLDFVWMQARAQQRLMKAQMDRAPTENLQALRDICDACESLREEKEPNPAAAGLPVTGPNIPMQPGAMQPGLAAPPPPTPIMPPGMPGAINPMAMMQGAA